jgi:hypothetical protein
MGRRTRWCRECLRVELDWRAPRRGGYQGFASEEDPSRCVDCVEREHARARATETMRRFEGWARYEGTRQRIATHLAGELRTRFGTRGQHDRERWCFVWETTGDWKMLRKIVTKLQRAWEDDRISVQEPPRVEAAGKAAP